MKKDGDVNVVKSYETVQYCVDFVNISQVVCRTVIDDNVIKDAKGCEK